MLKKIFTIFMALTILFAFVACASETTQEDTVATAAPTPEATPIVTPEPTPEPLIMMSDDLLGVFDSNYKTLTKAIKPLYENNITKADDSEAFDIDNGISAAIFYLLQETSSIDCNVLGYKYVDNSNESYLRATYKEYEGKPNSIKFEGIYLNYAFTCESKEYAFKLMERDVNALCTFADVEASSINTTAPITQETCDALINDNGKVTVTINKNVSADILVFSENDTINYNIKVTIR